MRIKRALALGAFPGLLAAVALAVPVQASGIKLACLTTGTLKTNPPIGVLENKGGYTFSDLVFACAGVEKSTSPVVVQFSFRSEGFYKNLVCGTGKAISTRNLHPSQINVIGTPKTNFQALATRVKYQVEIVGGQGLLYFHNDDVTKAPIPKLTSGTPLDPKPADKSDGGFGGFVELTPDPTKEFAPCLKSVQMTALLIIDTEELLGT